MAEGALADIDRRTKPEAAGVSVAAPVLARAVRVLLWVAGFAVALWLCLQLGTGISMHNDFTQNSWLPARLVLDGVNPYTPTRAQVDAQLGEFSSQYAEFNGGKDYFFVYPIWVALAMTPFATMPLVLAIAVWRALNLVLLLWACAALLRSSSPSFRSLRPAAVAALGMTLLLAVVFRESFLTLYIGQFAIIEFGLLVAIWGWLISSEHLSVRNRLWGDALTGLALAALATKPQSVGLAVLLVAVWALFRRRWVIPASAAVSLMLLWLGPLLFYPGSVADWLSVTFGRGQAVSQTIVSASVWGWSYQLLGDAAPWGLVAGVLSLAGLALLVPRWLDDFRNKSAPMPLSLPLTLCVNSVISPYMLGYEHVLMLFPAMLFLAAAGLPDEVRTPQRATSDKLWRIAIYVWMAIVPFLVVAVQGVLQKEYPAIAQSASMLALCWVARFVWVRQAMRDEQ